MTKSRPSPRLRGFVDTHTHMIPSGDDGVRSVSEGVELVLAAAERGTSIVYGTPHAIERYPVTDARRAAVVRAQERMRAALDSRVDLRLGWEIGPERWFLTEDPADYAMEGLRACLLELPLPHTRPRSLEMFVRCAEHIEAAGLRPILGHPERCELVTADPAEVDEWRERGWLVQVNASSMAGAHGRTSARLGWEMVASGQCDLVASDAHGTRRPPFLDRAFRDIRDRIGHEQALRIMTGAALDEVAAAPVADGS
jgi:protein-tyrosine phosphatase